jgi:hypothetical protein
MAFKMFALAKDELMLAAAVSVSLGSFGYIAVPWGGLGMGPADRALALYEQIEKANQEYFDKYGLWPHEVTDNTPEQNAAVLMSRVPLAAEYRNSKVYQPVMEGLLDTRGADVVARHGYGQGGDIASTPLNGGAYRYVVEFSNLTLDEARELDEAVDGEFGATQGRLRIVERDGTVVAKYLANPRDGKLAAK